MALNVWSFVDNFSSAWADSVIPGKSGVEDVLQCRNENKIPWRLSGLQDNDTSWSGYEGVCITARLFLETEDREVDANS